MASVDKCHASVAASVNVLFRNLGIALGTAVAGIMYGSFLDVEDTLMISPGVGALLIFLVVAVILAVMSAQRGLNNTRRSTQL